MIRVDLGPQLSIGHLVVASLLSITYYVVVSVMRHRRETSALKLAPAVYQAGGDPADVLRAIGGKSAVARRWRRGRIASTSELAEPQS